MKYLPAAVFLFLSGFMATSAFASSTVHVTNNVSTNSTTSNTGSSHTHVEIETNGNKKVFDSTGEDVHWQSHDGTSTVDINNNGSQTQSQSTSGNNHASVSVHSDGTKEDASKSSEVTPSAKPQTEAKKQNESFFSQIKDWFASLFSHDDKKPQHLSFFGFQLSF